MAKVYPTIISDEISSDPRRRAELEVYNILKEKLPETFHVFYSCNWLDRTGQGYREDGEADFIVAHEKFGFIVLEVKGGVISRDENTRQWYSRDRRQNTHKIKNPVEQAKVSKHYLIKKLKEKFGNSLGFVRAKHAVIFPDSGKPRGYELGSDMPLDIFMFLDDMPSLEEKVIEVLLHDAPSNTAQYSSLTKAGINELIRLFNQGFVLEPSIFSRIKSCEFRIQELTAQQQKCLSAIEGNPRMLISGGAGTGKTSLAIEKSINLAENGFEVLFLCFNSPLASHLQKRLHENSNVKVFSFHQFCLYAAKLAKLNLPNEQKDDFFKALPYLVLEALDTGLDLKFDAIIIDEGQDFEQEWIDCLESCLRGGDGDLFYVFFDDNQKIYKDRINNKSLTGAASYKLNQNVRNSLPIFGASYSFYQGSQIEPLGPEGLDIDWLEADDSKRDASLEKCLNRLVNLERISLNEIAILTAKSRTSYNNFSLKKYEFVDAENTDEEKIILDSIYRFKGLEKEVIILIDLKHSLDNERLMYVGFSRARSLLIILDDFDTLEALKTQTSRINDMEKLKAKLA